jgi:hypothetical protein
MIESEANRNHFFIRPRKFGKSLFFSMLSYYYDINLKNDFDKYFGNLYIGKNPTPERNSCAMLTFDFSGLDTSGEDEFKESFSLKVQSSVRDCLVRYHNVFPESQNLLHEIVENKYGISSLNMIFSVAKNNGVNIFVIIDEYDHFANDLIAMGNIIGEDLYKTMVRANGLVRDFYERIKDATKTSVRRTFITGISPVMLDDLTSGYNIAEILTLNQKYNEMMGFTNHEIKWLMTETGVNPDFITIDIEKYYNGYLFNIEGENRVYNPAMVLYFFNQIIQFGKPPQEIIDLNLQSDYGRLQKLTQNEKNRNTLIQIMKDGYICANVLRKFSIDMIYDDDYFVSLLFYMGLLTIKDRYMLQTRLCIPNYTIQTIYWEYLAKLIRQNSPTIQMKSSELHAAIVKIAMQGEIHHFIDYVSKNAFSKLSDYDLQRFDEKYIQILLLAYLFMSNIYVPMSEYETVPGRADIYLHRSPLLPEIRYEWIFEIKYCKASSKPAEIEAKKEEGLQQLEQYVSSFRLQNRSDLKSALLVFIGKDKFEIIEFS